MSYPGRARPSLLHSARPPGPPSRFDIGRYLARRHHPSVTLARQPGRNHLPRVPWLGRQSEAVSVADQLERLRAALSDRYPIERELGSGGLATVGGYVSRANDHGLGGARERSPSLRTLFLAERVLVRALLSPRTA